MTRPNQSLLDLYVEQILEVVPAAVAVKAIRNEMIVVRILSY
jgi:hypothetical protein